MPRRTLKQDVENQDGINLGGGKVGMTPAALRYRDAALFQHMGRERMAQLMWMHVAV